MSESHPLPAGPECLVPSPTGSSQQYLGQEEYYSEQYSHSQGAAEPMSQQYYPDGKACCWQLLGGLTFRPKALRVSCRQNTLDPLSLSTLGRDRGQSPTRKSSTWDTVHLSGFSLLLFAERVVGG